MRWVFWVSLLLVGYTYAGYPLWLYLRFRLRSRPIQPGPISPFVSIILAVHNEENVLPAKLRNLAGLNYPENYFEVCVVSDGSTDGTKRILEANKQKNVRVIISPQHEGKACALNRGIQRARGQIIAFTDARQMIEPDAIRHLVANFADPTVGCVSGELFLGKPDAGTPLDGVGLYWSMERKIRYWEGAAGSVVGATGALYAVRREFLVPLPTETILDDVYVPLHVARQGARVVFEPRARAWDHLVTSSKQEFHRKVRTLTGNYQLLQLAPWLLTRANPLRFEFVSHKLLRLIVPFALAGVLLSSAFLEGAVYELAVVLQLLFYGLGVLATYRPKLGIATRLADVALTFLVLNTAATVAFVNFVTGKKEVWVR